MNTDVATRPAAHVITISLRPPARRSMAGPMSGAMMAKGAMVRIR